MNSDKSHDRTGQTVVEGLEIQRQNSGKEQIGTLLDRQREQILADCQEKIQEHEFQADYDRRSTQKLSETIESQQEELHRSQAEEFNRRDQQLLHEQLLEQNGIFVKLISKVLMKWKNWNRWILSLNSRPEIRNNRMKSTVWMTREILKMLNEFAVEHSTLPVNQCFSNLIQFLAEC